MAEFNFHFVTLFPETIDVWFNTSILGKAKNKDLFSYEVLNLRDYAEDKHRSVDDSTYGGGKGMVFKIEPLVKLTESLFQKYSKENVFTVYFSPQGKRLSQNLINTLSPTLSQKHILLICGHYEGIDQRYIDHWVDLEVSLGDFVITGGEIPAIAFADCLIRQIKGVLSEPNCHQNESFSLKNPSDSATLLEYPQYTRPADFRGLKVPEILLKGNHVAIEEWRLNQAIKSTAEKRPDLIK